MTIETLAMQALAIIACIRKGLKQAVDQALVEAHEILAAEGLVAGEAA